MVKDFRVTVDGETYDVDSVEEATELVEEVDDDHDEIVPLLVRRSGEEWVATLADPDLDYEGRGNRKWGAVLDLVETVDERARRFGF